MDTDSRNFDVNRTWLRAVEWQAWPSFLSQPIVPVLYLFYPWYRVLLALAIANLLWLPVRAPLANHRVAFWGCLFVRLKWITTPIVAVFFLSERRWGMAVLTALTTYVVVLPGFFAAGRTGLFQRLFMQQLGYQYDDVTREFLPARSDAQFRQAQQEVEFNLYDPPEEVVHYLKRHGWKDGDPPRHYVRREGRWCDPLAPERWFVWEDAFRIQQEREPRAKS